MAITRPTLRFINYCHKQHGNFKKTLVIGRQELFLKNLEINKIIFPKKTDLDKNDYWDDLLIKCYKSTQVTNLDISNYEGADLIANLNLPINFKKKFDTIIQLGSIEHMINPLQAFININKLAGKNSLIIHQLPTNNYIDHGFYQFSPDFFKVFYKKNFKYQEILLADIKNDIFYEDLFKMDNLYGWKKFNSNKPVDVFFKCIKKNSFKLNFKNLNQPKYSVITKKRKVNNPLKIISFLKKNLNKKIYKLIRSVYYSIRNNKLIRSVYCSIGYNSFKFKKRFDVR